ncbi:hypothetical protein LCGC14_1277910 [marine sediment metagenome]|uniref:Uncharacterized protein n=1 Tax=marine sediment metagenome TaxID=412755 RepID=A0A0F9NZ52_9ZZZZ
MRSTFAFPLDQTILRQFLHGAMDCRAGAAKFNCDIFVTWQLVTGRVGPTENPRPDFIPHIGPGKAPLIVQIRVSNCRMVALKVLVIASRWK